MQDLNEPKSANTLAEAIGAQPENTVLFLDSLAVCDLLEKKKGMHQNSLISQTFIFSL